MCKYPFPTQNAADEINEDQFLSELYTLNA